MRLRLNDGARMPRQTWKKRLVSESGRETAFHQAQQAVDFYLDRISRSKLQHVPHLQPLRRDLLTQALHYYQAFVRQHRDDPTLRLPVAGAYLSIGNLNAEFGETVAAIEALENGLAISEELLKDSPGNPEYQEFFPKIATTLGGARVHVGRLDDTGDLIRRAIGVSEDLIAKHPDKPEFHSHLAAGYHNLAMVHEKNGALGEAAHAYQKAIDQSELARKCPSDDRFVRRFSCESLQKPWPSEVGLRRYRCCHRSTQRGDQHR